jgi:hypothetical protein
MWDEGELCRGAARGIIIDMYRTGFPEVTLRLLVVVLAYIYILAARKEPNGRRRL